MGYTSPEDKFLPRPRFKSLKALDRYRKLCLWLPVTIASKSIPWGYKNDPNDPKSVLPDPKALACFLKARDYLKTHSYHVVTEWLATCGYPIGDDGFKKLFYDRPLWPEIELPYEERLKL